MTLFYTIISFMYIFTDYFRWIILDKDTIYLEINRTIFLMICVYKFTRSDFNNTVTI